MMLLSQSVCLILLALSFLVSRARSEIMGYRTVSKEEANIINQRRKPYRDDSFDKMALYFNYLGVGYSLVNVPAGWPSNDDEWHCVIEADSNKLDAVSKIWIPEYFDDPTWFGKTERVELWDAKEEVIKEYIEIKTGLDAEKTLRFSPAISQVKHMDANMLQMVIPTKAIKNDELGFWAHCFEEKQELLNYSKETIPWDQWEIQGFPSN
ncbi:hypothetical protein MBM_01655 [Drepanopeziza brunnea f. sp. 'multigermtubi' MB_m1]|uniref:Uncharacterized protein n=1 Tax=Marssonina brunnea f. sp. multigermtubi (strain MB_m1) TaxID=1072389 RepID=K1XFY0_MARBU|nr:uncharacterized protein MBM_01655 [Drepanopeziza brunnea f. sp. 'multigermtubi' MB_m1]EKD19703.1 hypothetical protein MBM_01655 [Drepanopeziza brunnea f. sp. 'multigermtubi' MB_m1]